MIERVNGTLLFAIKTSMQSVTKWHEVLPQTLYQYRTTPHEATGKSPFEIMYGKAPRIHHIPPISFEVKGHSPKMTPIKPAPAFIRKFQPGAIVWLRRPNPLKMEPLFEGPYEIVEMPTPQDAIIEVEGNKTRVNITRLKLS